MENTIDFKKDVREQVINILKENNINFNEKSSTCELLINYLNALNKRISTNKRKVLFSDNIQEIINSSNLNKKYIDAIFTFKNNFENGIDMNGHLSTNIYYSELSLKKKNKIYRQSRDYLLDDWGIYHIHLNEKEAKNENEMHGNRSEYLLFVKVTIDKVYFIDILNHNEKNVFAKQELLKVLDRNWPFLLEKYRLHGINACTSYTDEEINKRRKNGEYILYNINGKVYMPIGGGLTSAGTNVSHTNTADNILQDIEIIESYIKDNYISIQKEVEDITGIKVPNRFLKFKMFLEDRGYVVEELNTGYISLFAYEDDCLKRHIGKKLPNNN